MSCEAGLREAVGFGTSLEPKKNSSEGLGTGWVADLPGVPCPGPQGKGNVYKFQTFVFGDLWFLEGMAPKHRPPPWSPLCVISMSLSPDPRLFAPSIKARFPPETYALVGQQVTLECFAFGK